MVARAVEPESREITAQEGFRIIDERTRRLFGLSVDEFRRKVEAGELDREDDDVARLVMILPLGR